MTSGKTGAEGNRGRRNRRKHRYIRQQRMTAGMSRYKGQQGMTAKGYWRRRQEMTSVKRGRNDSMERHQERRHGEI